MDRLEQIDEFESMFRRSEREAFVFVDVPIESVALVTGDSFNELVAVELKRFLPRIGDATSWHSLGSSEFGNVAGLLERLAAQPVDLLVTRRHLGEESLSPQHSLGVFLDELTQRTSIPVLVLPGTAGSPQQLPPEPCCRAMVVADHISGDHRLINFGVRMCSEGGSVWLCHVEDDMVFRRFVDAIERIPEIATEPAAALLEAQLLKEAEDFIASCIATLEETGPEVTLHSHVGIGHHVREYRRLIDEHEIDLLVANTKDDDQLAMHGMAYSLSIELVDVPLLLL